MFIKYSTTPASFALHGKIKVKRIEELKEVSVIKESDASDYELTINNNPVLKTKDEQLISYLLDGIYSRISGAREIMDLDHLIKDYEKQKELQYER